MKCVLIPADEDAREFRDFYPEDCTVMTIEGDRFYAECFREGEESPSYVRRDGKGYRLVGGEEVPLEANERLELLPDICIVKVPTKEYWCEEVQAQVAEIWGVYMVDRMKHVHLCEFTPSYEMWFIEHQFDYDDEEAREDLEEMIREGSIDEDSVSYRHVSEVDQYLQNVIHPGYWPKPGEAGGYVVTGLSAVTEEGSFEELMEARCNGDL